jgi:hypothetical protein
MLQVGVLCSGPESFFYSFHLVTNHCIRGESVRSRPFRSKRQGIRVVGGVADKEAYTVHAMNIISQLQYFVARCLSSHVSS